MNTNHTYFKRNGFALLTVLLALLMVAGALHSVFPTEAADTVCGDGVFEQPEACDDGNLKNGDGCSSACTVEACGNSVVDFGEQCDDGGTLSGDGCNKFCQIEFCGDSVVQKKLGEQCDDGNGVSNDGCSSSCQPEISEIGPSPESSSSSSSAASTPYIPPPLPYPIITDAKLALTFIKSKNGEDYMKYLTREEVLQLETILTKLSNGRRLNTQERGWSVALMAKLEEAKLAERIRYTDLLKQFISTSISSDVVEEKELEKSRLVDVEVPIAIDELQTAVETIRRGELKAQVSSNIGRLKRQGIDFVSAIPIDYEMNLDSDARPIEVFATLKTLKETAESFSTQDVPVSLETIRAQVKALKEALPILQKEYDIDPEELTSLLDVIDDVSLEVTKKDTDRVVAAVNRFLAVLERDSIFSTAEIASLELNATHAAATASRLLADAGREDVVTPQDVEAFVDGLSSAAPARAKPAFEQGSDIAQRVELLKFLQDDTRLTELRAILREDGRTDFDERYTELRESIGRIGTGNDPETVCDDSIQDALRCSSDYLSELQDAVRNRSFYSRFIGNLQDYFGIGQ